MLYEKIKFYEKDNSLFILYMYQYQLGGKWGPRLKKVYNEVYSEYESIMIEQSTAIFTFREGNDLNQNTISQG